MNIQNMQFKQEYFKIKFEFIDFTNKSNAGGQAH